MAKNESDANAATDAESSDASPLSVSVEDVGSGRKCVTIEVPADRIAAKLDTRYKNLLNDAAVPGFRRGRAPMRLIERRFGTAVRDEIRAQIVSESYAEALEKNELDVMGEPDLKDLESLELPESGPLAFKIEVEVAPIVELPSLEGITVTRHAVQVTDQDIEAELARMCERFGQASVVEDAAIEASDHLTAKVRILSGEKAGDDAEVIAESDGLAVRVPAKATEKGQVAGIVVDRLAKQLIGKQTGDEVRISTTGPSGHEREEIRDQPITIAMRINRVDRLIPLTADALVEQYGMSSADDLKKYLSGALESRHQREQQHALHVQVRDHLVDEVDLELPEGLTGRQTERLIQRRSLELASLGLPEPDVQQRLAEERAGSEDEARRQLKLFFVLNQAAKQLEVEVSDEELNGQIAHLAAEQGRRPQNVRQQMQRGGELEHLHLLIREHKTLDRILEKAKITDAEPEDAPKTKTPRTKKSSKSKSSKKEKA